MRQSLQRRFAAPAAIFIILLSLGGCARSHRPAAIPPSAVSAPANKYEQALQEAVQLRPAIAIAGQGVAKDYLIGPGDVLEIKVFEQDGMSITARVSGEGAINFPPLGVLHVSGLNERQLETRIQDGLRGKYLQAPHVSVFLKEPHARQVAIFGQVKTPGLYPCLGELTLVDLLSLAGGLTDKSGGTVYVVREGDPATDPVPAVTAVARPSADANPNRILVDLDGLLLRGEAHRNIRLQPGDRISIPEMGWVRVTGNGVAKPGTYPLKGAQTRLTQMIDEAGGLNFSASRKLTLIRKVENGNDQLMPVPYNSILKDRARDPVVQPGDTVIADRSAPRAVLAGIGSAFAQIFRISLFYNFSTNSGD
jgi:polysaccharide export outer membrane protein